MGTELERRIRDLRVVIPDPPEELRSRALAAARQASGPRRQRLSRSRARTVQVVRVVLPVAGATAIAGILVVALPKGTPPSPPGTLIEALDRPQGPKDILPSWVAGDPAVTGNAIDPASTRLAWTGFSRHFYLASGKATRLSDGKTATGSPTICLINAVTRTPSQSFRPGRPGWISCQLLEVFRRSGLPMWIAGSRRTVKVVGVVPDGYTTVSLFGRSTPVRGNFFSGAFPVNPRSPGLEKATLSGPAGSRPLEGVRIPARPADSVSQAVHSYGLQPVRGLDRPYEPMVVNIRLELRRGYDTVTIGGRVARARGRVVVLRAVPASPFLPLKMEITGPAGKSELELDTSFVGRSHDMLNPYRRSSKG